MQPVPNQPWTSGLCDCANDISSCCLAWWCPCIQYGKNLEMLNKTPCCGSCCTYAILCWLWCPWCITHATRGAIRSTYGIQGQCCTDCCAQFWCPCCALAQECREIKTRKAAYASVGSQMNQVAIVQQPMMMQPGQPGMMQPGMMQPGMMQPGMPPR